MTEKKDARLSLPATTRNARKGTDILACPCRAWHMPQERPSVKAMEQRREKAVSIIDGAWRLALGAAAMYGCMFLAAYMG